MDKYGMLFEHIQHLRIRDVRLLFSHMRKLANEQEMEQVTGVLFPAYGFTVGEFTTAYITNMPTRAKTPAAATSAAGRGPEDTNSE